jgi:hypothetical protein
MFLEGIQAPVLGMVGEEVVVMEMEVRKGVLSTGMDLLGLLVVGGAGIRESFSRLGTCVWCSPIFLGIFVSQILEG